MNPLTQIKNTQKATQREISLGLGESASWHVRFKHSAYVFAGGLDYDLTEGDLLAVFAQYGEIVDVHLAKDKATGKSRGFSFLAYEDQRSTVLAVDNLNGAKVAGRVIRVEHVDNYKKRKAELEGEPPPEEEADAGGGGPQRDGGAGAGGPPASRWPHDKADSGQPAFGRGPRPPGEAGSAAQAGGAGSAAGGKPPLSSDPWAAPGSLFSLLTSGAAAARPSGSGGGAEGREPGGVDAGRRHTNAKEHKKEKHKKEKHKKEKHARDKGEKQAGKRSRHPSASRSRSPPPESRPRAPAVGPPRPPSSHARPPTEATASVHDPTGRVDSGAGGGSGREGRGGGRSPRRERDISGRDDARGGRASRSPHAASVERHAPRQRR